MESRPQVFAEIDTALEKELADGLLVPGPLAIFFWAGIIWMCENRKGKKI